MAIYDPHIFTNAQIETQSEIIIRELSDIEPQNIVQDFKLEQSYDLDKQEDKYWLRVELVKEINRETAIALMLGENK
jgi:hypothetical protein